MFVDPLVQIPTRDAVLVPRGDERVVDVPPLVGNAFKELSLDLKALNGRADGLWIEHSK